MALNIIPVLGTTTIPGLMDIVNNNFTELNSATQNFLDIYDTSGGNIDISINPTGVVRAKQIVIPLGNSGITVGNSTVLDNSITTKTTITNVVVDSISSLQTKTFAVNATGSGAVAIGATNKTLLLDPTASGLHFEISSSVSDAMTDLFIINLSSTNDSCILNITSNFIDHSAMTTITIPFKKNLHLRYINNTTTSTTGWYLVSQNGCTIA